MATGSARDILNGLMDTVKIEANSGMKNSFQDRAFAEVLADQLDVLARALPDGTSNEACLRALRALTTQYSMMTPEERDWVLQDVNKLVNDISRTIHSQQVGHRQTPADEERLEHRQCDMALASRSSLAPPSHAKVQETPSKRTYDEYVANASSERRRRTFPCSTLTWTQQTDRGFSAPEDCSCWVPIVFDLETTGLSIENSLPIEIAAFNPLNNESFSSLIKLPGGIKMTPKAEEMTGLSALMLQDESIPEFETVYLRFLRFIEEQVLSVGGDDALPILVGHNIRRFDVQLLLRRAREKDLPFPLDAAILDTLLTSRELIRKSDGLKYNLSDLVKFFGGIPLDAHRASVDVQMTHFLLKKLLHISGITTEQDISAFFRRPRLPTAFHAGFVGHLLSTTTTTPRVGEKTPQRRPRTSVLVARSQFAARKDISSSLDVKEGGTGASTTTTTHADAYAEISADDAFSVEAWAADDPLTWMDEEEEQMASWPDNDTTKGREIEACVWSQIFAIDPAATSLLDLPIENVSGRVKFTGHQLRDSKAAGFIKLRDVLQQWPKAYVPTVVGALPDLNKKEEQSICLLASIQDPDKDLKVTFSKSGWAILTAILTVIPQESAPVLPSHHADVGSSLTPRNTRICFKVFRKGKFARNVIFTEEKKLRNLGDRFGIAGRVMLDDLNDPITDTWALKSGSFRFLAEADYYQLASTNTTHYEPVYTQRGNVQPQRLASLVAKAISVLKASRSRWEDPIPKDIRDRYGIEGFLEALEGMHSPNSPEHYEESRRGIAFQELFELQLRLLIQRKTLQSGAQLSHNVQRVIDAKQSPLADLAEQALPFQLTKGQLSALDRIRGEMSKPEPMMSLLQGDVGCGKTAVAMLTALDVVHAGHQTAIMAPTEILAEQHFRNMSSLLSDMHDVQRNIMSESEATAAAASMDDATLPALAELKLPSVALLTGSTPRSQRDDILRMLEEGSLDMVIGTHALIHDTVVFKNLGFSIVDEQHKFGVQQRAKLLTKASPPPHVLYMSATPIPRSLALALHGTLRLITISDLPPGRSEVRTQILLESSETREQVHSRIREEIAAGGQVFIVCPLIETTESDLKAAVQERDRLVGEGIVGVDECQVLHGRMTAEEKASIMAAFVSGQSPVLISTTVIEVGVDVPAASLIIVEHSNRFGLAQLHQLRGRVGRGGRASTCLLMSDSDGEETERLRILERSSSGFDVAEADFLWRGGGEILGKRQSGRDGRSTVLQVARLPDDASVLESAREAAARQIARTTSPMEWPKELLSSIAAAGPFELDMVDMPDMTGS